MKKSITLCLFILIGFTNQNIISANEPSTKNIQEIKKLMTYETEKKEKMFFIGISVRTSNAPGRFMQDVPPLCGKFYQENLSEKIPNKLNKNVLTVYTDYEGDYTQPFTFLIGCEVSNLDRIPEGMSGVEIAASSYAVFKPQGSFPQSLSDTWHAIWNSDVKRLYTTDFEVYSPDFNPQTNPDVKVFIAKSP